MEIKLPNVENYILTCGRLLQVRQALHDEGVRWPYGESPLVHRLDKRDLLVEGKTLRYISDLTSLIGNRATYPVFNIEDLRTCHYLTLEQIFERFLRKHKALTKFKENLKPRKVKECFDISVAGTPYEIHSRGLVAVFFSWEETPDGNSYWSSLHSLWVKLLRELDPNDIFQENSDKEFIIKWSKRK